MAVRAVAAALALSSPPSELAFITNVQIGLSQGRMRNTTKTSQPYNSAFISLGKISAEKKIRQLNLSPTILE